MPNIENLKKQAKQYLRWHRERYYPVAAQIRAALPRFRHIGDVQILESSFKLADAQELVARQMGFDGWQALKSGADAVTDAPRQTTPRAILSSISAQLFVANIKSSCDLEMRNGGRRRLLPISRLLDPGLPGCPVTHQVGNSLRHSSTLRNFSRLIAFLLSLEEFLQERARRSRLLFL